MEGKKIMDLASVKMFIEKRKNRICGIVRPKVETSQPLSSRKQVGFELVYMLAGFILAAYLCLILENVLMTDALKWRMKVASDLSQRAPSFASAASDRKLADIEKVNPFSTVVDEREEDNASFPVSSFTLAGTLPDIGAWIRDDSSTQLVLRGQKVRGYTLEDIDYGRVLLSANGNSYPLYLVLSGGEKSASVSNKPPSSELSKPKPNYSAIVPAKDNQEGSIPSELVNQLVMNPYDEVAKMRMVPSKEGGMEIQRIAPDSVLGMVGVAQGDVVKSLNGIEVKNLGDIANAVNSVVSGTRLDVTVQRGGKPVELKYQVK